MSQPAAQESRFNRFLYRARNPGETFVDAVYDLLGSKWCGNVNVPLDHKTLRIDGKIVSFGNDAFEVWLGTPTEWGIYFKRTDFLKVALWFLFQWSVCDCFGLRRRAWYWALTKRVERYRQFSLKAQESPSTEGKDEKK